jgi:hypothetical protein
MRNLAIWLLLIIIGKEDETMMAMFFAQRVILGKTAYKDVPAKLKDQVKELLVDAGLPELVEE